jgi:hypothetical protein
MTRISVRSLTDARAALAAGAPVTLVGEAGLAGIGWWREMLKLLNAEFGTFEAVLDCGPAPGLALAALRAGIPRIEVEASPEILEKLQAIARQMGARVERRLYCR